MPVSGRLRFFRAARPVSQFSLAVFGIAISLVIALPAAALAASVEEIVVTAQKRSQSLAEVPISVGVIGGEELRQLNLNTPLDIVLKIPGLDVDQGGGGTIPRWSLRGQSFTSYQPGNGTPVAVYYDEVFAPDIMQGMPLFDLERVEVLRGPQGTLWGNSTTGGLIHFISAKPQHSEFGGYTKIGVGNFSQFELQGAINVPIVTDKVAARFSYLYDERESYFSNRFPGSRGYPDDHSIAGRAQLLWEASDKVSLLFNVHKRDFQGTAPIFNSVGQGPDGEDAQGYVEDPDPFVVSKNYPEDRDNQVEGVNLRASLDFGSMELVSITAFDSAEEFSTTDGDSSPNWVDQDSYFTDRSQFSQELRLSGGDSFRWNIGGYLYDSELTSDISFAAPPDLAFFSAQTQFDQDDEYIAGFAHGTFTVTDSLDVSAGIRFTEEDKSIDFYQVFYTSNPEVNEFEGQFSPDGVFENDDSQKSDSWSETSWDLSATYRISEGNSVYAKAARGFRGGNFDSGSFSGDLRIVDPEIITLYELGGHFLSSSGRFRAKGTLFYYELDDAQINGAEASDASFSFVLFNAPTSEATGLEVDMDFQVSDAFSLNAGLALIDAEYGDVVTDDPLGNEVNISGNQFRNAPKYTGFLGLLYERDTQSGIFSVRTDWRLIGETYFSTAGKDVPDVWLRDSFAMCNVRMSLASADGRREIAVWGRNITDENDPTYVSPRIFNGAAFPSGRVPRTYGVSATFNF